MLLRLWLFLFVFLSIDKHQFVCTFVCIDVLFRFCVTTVVATGSQSTAVVALRHRPETYFGDLCNGDSSALFVYYVP